MANIANGYLSINLDKASELDKSVVEDIINNLENNNHFTYCGDCECTFNEEDKVIDLSFCGRWSCDSCWEWIENEISDDINDKELNLEARIILLNSEISGGSYEYGSQYRDKVYKRNGDKKLDRYNHTKLESEWWEVLEIINAFNLNQGVPQNFGNDVEVTLCEKSEREQYLFKIVGGVGGFIVLYDKSDKDDAPQPIFFCDIDEFTGSESINEILEGLESGDLEQEEDQEEWFGNGELIDDLIGEIDKYFELS